METGGGITLGRGARTRRRRAARVPAAVVVKARVVMSRHGRLLDLDTTASAEFFDRPPPGLSGPGFFVCVLGS